MLWEVIKNLCVPRPEGCSNGCGDDPGPVIISFNGLLFYRDERGDLRRGKAPELRFVHPTMNTEPGYKKQKVELLLRLVGTCFGGVVYFFLVCGGVDMSRACRTLEAISCIMSKLIHF